MVLCCIGFLFREHPGPHFVQYVSDLTRALRCFLMCGVHVTDLWLPDERYKHTQWRQFFINMLALYSNADKNVVNGKRTTSSLKLYMFQMFADLVSG